MKLVSNFLNLVLVASFLYKTEASDYLRQKNEDETKDNISTQLEVVEDELMALMKDVTNLDTEFEGTRERESLSKSCSNKLVQIYKFCINGDADSGAHGEHQIKLDGEKYFPMLEWDCKHDPEGFCSWREGQCHNLSNPQWFDIRGYKSLTVGTEEYDSSSPNDSTFATLEPGKWVSPTCDIYEVKVARDFSMEKKVSFCTTLKNSNSEIKKCESWTEPAQSYIWYLKVVPDDNHCAATEGQSDYRGTISKTVSGKTCQRWDSQSPHDHKYLKWYSHFGLDQNYCRNPSDHDRAWCYTTDPNTRWENCDVPNCA